MDAVYGAIGVVLVSIITGIVTWLTARRTKSGKIDTSEATKLWDEGTEMRRELRTEIVALKFQLGEAVQAVADLNYELQRAREEVEISRKQQRECADETHRLSLVIDELRADVSKLPRGDHNG